MIKKRMTKSQIEDFLKNKGDFSKIDYLTRYLEQNPSIEMKKFAFLKLAEIYANRKMYLKSAEMLNSAAVNSILFSDKIKSYVEATKMYAKAGAFDRADESAKKAISEANSHQRQEIYNSIKDIYKKLAEEYERSLKRNNAARVYEHLLQMRISYKEKLEIKKRLLMLYEQLGKFKEYNNLKNLLGKKDDYP